MGTVRMIRNEPGLVSIKMANAIYCWNCTVVSNSGFLRCGLCGSGEIVDLASILGGIFDPEPTSGAAGTRIHGAAA